MTKAFRLTIPLCLAAAAAWANPATTDGAIGLTEVFQTYFGTQPGVVTVVPQGDTYAVILNAAPLIALIDAPGMNATLTPLALTLTDQGAGLWGVVVDQAFDAEFSAPDLPGFHVSIGHMAHRGTFDERLSAFSEQVGQYDKIVSSQSGISADDSSGAGHYEVSSLHLESTATASPTGGIDETAKITVPEALESIVVPDGEAGAALDVGLTVTDYAFTGTIKGYRSRAVLDLVAFVVAHASEQQMQANLPALKGLLTAALPVFDSFNATGTNGSIKAVTPMGDFTLDGGTFAVDLHGGVPDGLARESFAVKGLKIPAGLVPDWAGPLLPTDAGLDFAVSGYDAKAAADLALGLLDQPLGQDPPPGFEDKLLAAALPTGVVTITLAPSVVSAPGYSFAYEGAMQVGPATDIPTGTAKFTLTGIDAIIAALNAAPDDIKKEIVPAVMLVRGMSKAGADGALVWDIDGSVPGKLLVNGNDVMSMMR